MGKTAHSSAKAPKKSKAADNPKRVAVAEIQPLVEAAWAALRTFDTLRREGTSFSRVAYIKGYKALEKALEQVPHYCFKEEEVQ